jgi:sulfate/thiosulfate transport system permease protein
VADIPTPTLTLDAEPHIRPGPVPNEPGPPGRRIRRKGGTPPPAAAPGSSLLSRWGLRIIALTYLTFLLILPVGLVFYKTFENGFELFWEGLTNEEAVHALQVTLTVAGFAVVFNTTFGLIASFLLVRHDFPGKRLLDKLIDLPLAVSPVVVGLALILVYGQQSSFGGFLSDQGIDIIYHQPGMIMATCFVSLPLMVREVAPILEEIGDDQEQAASTLGASPFTTFRRITLPSIRWGLAYGVVLTLARSLGEYGAVAVVSGKVVGETQTTTLYVERSFENFDKPAAYAGAFLLAFLAIVALLLMNIFRPKEQ